MYSFKGNDNITVFDAEELELIDSINSAAKKGSFNFPLQRKTGESNISYFERLVDYAKSTRNQ